jgi:hypothetical protein
MKTHVVHIIISLISSGNEKCFRKKVLEKIKTHFVLNNLFSEYSPVYGIMWTNAVESERPQVIIRRMRVSCWITKAANTHSEYVILVAFPLQQ